MLVSCALTAPDSAADITAATWVNDNLFNYRVMHMPDLDQRRNVLPCNGNIHCVPTCAVNMVCYAANHGFPSVNPGPHFWDGNGNYGLASTTIFDMGVDMATSCASGGTSGGPANTALIAWLANNPGLVVNDHLNVPGYATRFNGIGKSLCGGRVGSISYGYYDVVGNVKGILVVDRDGGHCTTVAKIRRNGGVRELWVRNPGSDEGDNTAQSVFANDVFTTTELSVIVMPNADLKTLTAINYVVGQNTIKLIDGHRTITPKVGYSWDSSLGSIVLAGPKSLTAPNPPPTHFPSPTGTAILSLDWHDLSNAFLAVCDGSEVAPTSLYSINPLNGASQQIPLAGSPKMIVSGRSNKATVLLCDANGVCDIITILEEPFQSPSQSPPPVLTLPHPVHAMVADDANDDVVMLSRLTRKLMRVDASLTGPISVLDIPSIIPLGTNVQLAINPKEPNIVWMWSNASSSLYRLEAVGATLTHTTLTHSAITAPSGFDFDDRGHLFVSNNGSIIELMFRSTSWQLVSGAMFAGQPAGTQFRMTRSRSNFTPGIHDTPGWTTNIDAGLIESFPQKPDCLADIAPAMNVDGVVNVDDLLRVINGWGPCANPEFCPSDITQNGFTNVDDLLMVINGWGPCP